MSGRVHNYTHVCRDGTTMSLEIDLREDVKVTTDTSIVDRPELRQEYRTWVESVVGDVIPLLNEEQLLCAALRGFSIFAKDNP